MYCLISCYCDNYPCWKWYLNHVWLNDGAPRNIPVKMPSLVDVLLVCKATGTPFDAGFLPSSTFPWNFPYRLMQSVSYDWEIWVGNDTPASAIFHSFFLKLNDIFHSPRWWLVVSQNFGDILSIFVFELLMHGWKVCMVFGVIYVQFSTFLCDSKFWFYKIIYFWVIFFHSLCWLSV